MPKKPASDVADKVLVEYEPLGKYRVRVLESKGVEYLDVREYIEGQGFEGFTRRGIRITLDDARALADTINGFDES